MSFVAEEDGAIVRWSDDDGELLRRSWMRFLPSRPCRPVARQALLDDVDAWTAKAVKAAY
ncbi:hypothetical protein JNB88_06930 [Rhizobium cauense]|uniref:hypothetical protein n=1 Tax=Rhizobium cauense TaxID=1166683 RepID=UPI001C6E70F4|nr:hypothetical protein [Rhizobium cauense]MBW9113381.1 hypothetical protein [Rhizobium cauense]